MADEHELGPTDPELVDEWRDEFRSKLQHMDAKDLMLDAAVSSRVAVRVLYRVQEPRIRKLERRAQVYIALLTILSITGPIVAAVLTAFISNGSGLAVP